MPTTPDSAARWPFIHWRIVGEAGHWTLVKYDGDEVLVGGIRHSTHRNDLIDFARTKGMLPLVHPDGRLDVSGT